MPIKSYTGSPYPSLGLKCVSKRPKVPKMAQNGPFRARQGPFLGKFWDHFWSLGANNTHACVLWCSNGSLYGQFVCYAGCILDIFWSFGSFWDQWSPFGGLLATIWAYPEPFWDLLTTIWAYPCGKVPPTRGWCPSLGPFGPYLGLCGCLFDV